MSVAALILLHTPQTSTFLQHSINVFTYFSAHSVRVDLLDEYDSGEMSSYDQPSIIRLLLAMWFIILSHSDILCYFMIFLNQIKSATFLSLPLPLLVFLWGTLSIPRPSKTFWVTVIAYTEVGCVFNRFYLVFNVFFNL